MIRNVKLFSAVKVKQSPFLVALAAWLCLKRFWGQQKGSHPLVRHHSSLPHVKVPYRTSGITQSKVSFVTHGAIHGISHFMGLLH